MSGLDFSSLTDDQLVELVRAACAEAVNRNEAVTAAAKAAMLSEAEKVEIARSATEREAARLRQVEQVIFLLYRFGDYKSGIPWSDAPYSWHLVPETERTMPPVAAGAERPLLTVMLVDAGSGIIRSRPRVLTLEPAFADQMHALIARQAELPFDPAEHDRQIVAAYQRYPTTAKMLRAAIARARGGANP